MYQYTIYTRGGGGERPINFAQGAEYSGAVPEVVNNSRITGGAENAAAHRCVSQLIVSLKNMGTTILLALTAYQTPSSLDGARLRGLDVDFVNSSSDHYAYLCTLASETTFRQKRMSIADRSHLRLQAVETKCKK
jgi:hypothetical protein